MPRRWAVSSCVAVPIVLLVVWRRWQRRWSGRCCPSPDTVSGRGQPRLVTTLTQAPGIRRSAAAPLLVVISDVFPSLAVVVALVDALHARRSRPRPPSQYLAVGGSPPACAPYIYPVASASAWLWCCCVGAAGVRRPRHVWSPCAMLCPIRPPQMASVLWSRDRHCPRSSVHCHPALLCWPLPLPARFRESLWS